jgi:hypothetical protein
LSLRVFRAPLHRHGIFQKMKSICKRICTKRAIPYKLPILGRGQKNFSYVLKQKNTIIPDSLKHLPIIPIPIKNDCGNVHYLYSLVEMLASNTLVGFPGTDYVSSEETTEKN